MVGHRVNVYSTDETQGTVSGGGEYERGSIATLVATPNEGYKFAYWGDERGDYQTTENPWEIEVWGNYTIYAYFEAKPVLIDGIEGDNVVIYTQNGVLYVEGINSDYHLFDATGKLIYTGKDAQMTLPKGIYLLNVEGKIYKVAM